MNAAIGQITKTGTLPNDKNSLFDLITNPDGKFISQEGVNWDFKGHWPNSHGDSYFYGIARLVCAFANTDGGLIVFGVDDKKRTAITTSDSGLPNLDSFEQAIENVIGTQLAFDHRRYDTGQNHVIDVLLVQRRPATTPPVRFQQTAHGYKKNVIWVRARHEVREAQSADISKLYLNRHEDSVQLPTYSSLPPSPSTVREFVGRMDCIDKIFQWMNSSDNPRHFLYGKGGSGKSTIAFEIAKAIKNSNNYFRIEGTDIVEKVIFVSAKVSYLNIDKLKSDSFLQNDFNTEHELYRAILTLGDFDISPDKFNNDSYLKLCIKEFLMNTSCFIVIDDIDTLTTAGIESGMDYMQGILWKSKKKSKILYTVRNRPSHSISSSIEVPGLPDGEYESFISACCKQFNVQIPDSEFIQGHLAEISERRPLVIESIIALRRNCTSYKNVIDVFHQSTGDDVRSYVFEREWNALSSADRGRELLAIIALYGKPVSFDDLCVMSKLDASKVQDAISQVQEMFLYVNGLAEESKFSLGSLTKKFVLHAAKELDFYKTIDARVKAFKSNFYPDSPQINAIKNSFFRARSNLEYYKNATSLGALWTDLTRGEYEPRIQEDPRFLVLRATTGILLDHRNLGVCRKDFESAFEMRSSPELDMVKIWFEAEKACDLSDVQTAKIVKYVCNDKGYTDIEKAEFITQRAIYLYNFSRDNIGLDTIDSIEKLENSIKLHAQAFAIYLRGYDEYLKERSWEYIRNTSYFLVQNLIKSRSSELFNKLIRSLCNKKNKYFLDPISEPCLYLYRRLMDSKYLTKADLNRISNDFYQIKEFMFESNIWFDVEERDFFIEEYSKLEKILRSTLKTKRSIASVRFDV